MLNMPVWPLIWAQRRLLTSSLDVLVESQNQSKFMMCAKPIIFQYGAVAFETGIGRAYNVALASKANFTIPGDTSPSHRYWAQDIVTPEWTMSNDGMMQVPTGPGLGVDIDVDRIESLTIEKETVTA